MAKIKQITAVPGTVNAVLQVDLKGWIMQEQTVRFAWAGPDNTNKSHDHIVSWSIARLVL